MEPSHSFVQAALDRGFITQAQANLLNEEISMFPGSNVSVIMLRRGMVSASQLKEIESGASSAPPPSALDDDDFDFGTESHDVSSALNPPAPLIQPMRPPAPVPESKTKSGGISAAIAAATHAVGKPSEGAYQPRAHTPVNNTATAQGSLFISQAAPPSNAKTIAADPVMLRLLKAGRERGCSDLHLTVGQAPYLRQNGKIYFLDEQPLSAEMSARLNRSVLTEEQQKDLDDDLQLDFSFGYPGVGRFRANVYMQRLGLEGAYRFIPDHVPTLESLGLPAALEKLTTYTQGLNLVTGPGGSGKTSTVAAMLEHINRHQHDHIITVEDPVEYVFTPQKCQITQREVGTHTESFASALRTALRQDPDVIMIGELRDVDTTSISITAAETGHLVFGTLHTSGAVRTVARILDVFPPVQRAQICTMVAESLRGITSQQLLERKDGKGRACAMEILLATTGVSQVIKEGKTHQLVSHMQSGRRLGMISMDDALMELFQSGVISGREAFARAENKGPFEMARNSD